MDFYNTKKWTFIILLGDLHLCKSIILLYLHKKVLLKSTILLNMLINTDIWQR